MFIRIFIVCILTLFGASAYLFVSGKSISLNDIETAAGMGSLSKFDDYMKEFKTSGNQDERWITLKKAELQSECRSSQPIAVTALPQNVLTEVSFKGSQAVPFAGSWVQSYRLNYCGQERQINILYTADGGNIPESRLMLDGTSLTGLVEQSDGILHAIRASRVNRLDCENWKVENTEFLGAEANAVNGAWQEKWSTSGCGSKYDVLMSFSPTEGFETQIKAEVTGKKL